MLRQDLLFSISQLAFMGLQHERDGTFLHQVCVPPRFPGPLCIGWIGLGISRLLSFVFDAFDTNGWAAGWLPYAGPRKMDIKNVYMWW